jgi:hypothetical protein
MTEDSVPILHCANHPNRETVLRCNRCDKPICVQCSVQTPVGFRCKECVRGQQAIYFNAKSTDLVIAGVVGLVLGGILGIVAYFVLGMIGWFRLLLAFLAGPAAGGLIAEAVRFSVRRRRARYLGLITAIACVIGALSGGILLGLLGPLPIFAFLIRLDVLLLAGLAASTIYARLR